MSKQTEVVKMTHEEWEARGCELFGADKLQWRFVCPSCGHVQTPEDFRQYKDQGATADSAWGVCIGRYDGHMDNEMCGGKSPCNYTSGGLININPVLVLMSARGAEFRIRAFAFADSKEQADG